MVCLRRNRLLFVLVFLASKSLTRRQHQLGYPSISQYLIFRRISEVISYTLTGLKVNLNKKLWLVVVCSMGDAFVQRGFRLSRMTYNLTHLDFAVRLVSGKR